MTLALGALRSGRLVDAPGNPDGGRPGRHRPRRRFGLEADYGIVRAGVILVGIVLLLVGRRVPQLFLGALAVILDALRLFRAWHRVPWCVANLHGRARCWCLGWSRLLGSPAAAAGRHPSTSCCGLHGLGRRADHPLHPDLRGRCDCATACCGATRASRSRFRPACDRVYFRKLSITTRDFCRCSCCGFRSRHSPDLTAVARDSQPPRRASPDHLLQGRRHGRPSGRRGRISARRSVCRPCVRDESMSWSCGSDGWLRWRWPQSSTEGACLPQALARVRCSSCRVSPILSSRSSPWSLSCRCCSS